MSPDSPMIHVIYNILLYIYEYMKYVSRQISEIVGLVKAFINSKPPGMVIRNAFHNYVISSLYIY